MTVLDLMSFLQQFPSDMEITEKRYSDMRLMDLSDWSTVWGFPTKSGDFEKILTKEEAERLIRSYHDNPDKLARLGASQYTPDKLKMYLFFNGN